MHTTNMSWSGALHTNAVGEREIGPLNPNWKYTIEASRAGFVKSSTDLPHSVTTVLQMPIGKTIRGRLLDANGSPLADRTIYAEKADEPPYSSGWVDADRRTDAEGYFEFTTLEAGEYRIRARLPHSPMAVVQTEQQDELVTLHVDQGK
jgi:protocatechuate 3,4-dioxygenase beta subunit